MMFTTKFFKVTLLSEYTEVVFKVSNVGRRSLKIAQSKLAVGSHSVRLEETMLKRAAILHDAKIVSLATNKGGECVTVKMSCSRVEDAPELFPPRRWSMWP